MCIRDSSSGITQPPILATILKEILDKNKINNAQHLNMKKIIKKIKKFHEWLIQFRDPKKTGLVSILHPWESGYDNSPIWDEPMNKVKIEKNIISLTNEGKKLCDYITEKITY